MAFVGLKVDENTKATWVAQAEQQGLSLSAWLKNAAEQHLNTLTQTTEQTSTSRNNPRGAPDDQASETADRIAEARALIEKGQT